MNGYDYYLKSVWDQTLNLIKTNGIVNEQVLDMFSTGSKLSTIEDSVAKIQTNNYLTFSIMDKYKGDIELCLQSILEDNDIKCAVLNSEEEKKQTTVTLFKNEFFDRELDPNMNFASFVLGKSNSQAQVASLTCAKNLGLVYNPLFIYGNSGLGKTHLLNAIGNEVTSNMPNKKIGFISGNDFIDALQKARKNGNTDEFKSSFYDLDLLLIDDIQFIAGKERTQEEFFHTFNTLHEANKQIILSSDRPPKEIPTLEDRLRSRFEWGLIADIQAPDFETRMAILKKKADVEKLNVPNEVMVYIATKIKSNIRELEGALIRIIAYSSLTNREVTVDLATEALKDIISNKQNKSITIDLIQDVVATYFNLRVEDLKSQRRTRNVAYPRQIAMYLSRKLTDMSLPKIGEEFGGRDHTTVIHAYEKISESLNKDESLEHTINDITKKLTQK